MRFLYFLSDNLDNFSNFYSYDVTADETDDKRFVLQEDNRESLPGPGQLLDFAINDKKKYPLPTITYLFGKLSSKSDWYIFNMPETSLEKLKANKLIKLKSQKTERNFMELSSHTLEYLAYVGIRPPASDSTQQPTWKLNHNTGENIFYFFYFGEHFLFFLFW